MWPDLRLRREKRHSKISRESREELNEKGVRSKVNTQQQ